MEQIHSLLKRQLKRHFGRLDSLPKEWQELLDAVNEAYWEFDADRSTLERSLDLSSQELLQANSEMRAVFRTFPDLFFRLDTDGTILDYKAGSTTDLYLPPEKLLGKRIQDIPLKGVGNKFQEAILQVQKINSLVSIEYSLKMEERKNFYEARLLPLFENQVIVIVRNITERKRAEEALRKSEHRYRSFIELTNTVAWTTSADGKVVEDIPTWRKYTGQSYEEIEGYGWSKALHPDDVERALQVWKKAVETKSAYETEYRVRRHDGFYRDFLARGTPVFKEDGSIQEWVGTCVDITERKRAEEALKESEERLKQVVEGAELGTWDQNMKTGEVIRNRRWAEMLGYTLEEINQHVDAWKAMIHPDDLPAVNKITQDHRAGRTPFLKCEHRIRTKSGEWKWILNCGKIIERDKDGKPLRAVGIHTDITERKRAEEALRESQEKYSAIVEKGNDGIIIIQNGLLKFANSTISTITGFTPEEAFEKPFVNFVSPAYRELVTKMYKRRMSGEKLPNRYESEILSKDGKSIPVEISASLIEYEGKPADLAIIRDITERKRAEELLRASEAQLSNAMKIAKLGYWEYDVAKDLFTFNDHFYAIFRTTAEKVGGYTMSSARYAQLFVHPEDAPMVAVEIQKALETTDPHFSRQLEHRIIYADGEIGYITVRFFIVKDDQGRTIKTYGANQDITERKRAEEALKESERKYSTIVEKGNDGIVIIQDGSIKFANSTITSMVGLAPEGIIGKPFINLISPTYREVVFDRYQERISGKEPPNRYEIELFSRDGKKILVDVSASLIEYEGRPADMAIIRDITERRQAEEELQRTHFAIDSAPEGIAWLDKNFHYIYVNEGMCRMLGYTRDELLSIEPSKLDLMFPQVPPSKLWAEMRGIKSQVREALFRRKDNTTFPVELAIDHVVFKNEEYIFAIMRDITERKQAEEKLRESEERYRDLFDNASDLIQSVDEKGKFVYVNKKWKEVLGYSDEEIKKLNLTDILRKDQIPHCMELFKKVMRGETLDNVEVVFVTKEGREIFASGFVNPWMKDGKFVATRAIFSDVTGRKRAEQALIEAKEQAEEANRLKSEFLANMSHEIRTPMNAIIGMTGITLGTDLTDDQRESLIMVKESAYALLGLLDGILDLSKIEAGRVEFETIDFDLRATVEGIADTLAYRASTKGLELACMIHHRVPTLLRGDPGRLRQILMNLGGNAVKFTEKGEVVIRVELSEETEDQATLLFSVTDTGIGIPKDKQEKIFGSFVQADGSTTRKYGGTGLGLSISKQLVKLLDGQIGVESQPGKGSRFWFTISFEKQKEFKRISPVIPSDICGMRILVVDDNQANRSILVKMLESSGCSSEAVGSGNEAIQVLKRAVRKEKLFDLVLLDMQMPEMDGEQTLRAIKADPELKDVLVVILTSIGIRGDVARLEALGCAGYLTKPIKQSQLFDTITTVWSQQKTVAKGKSLGSMGPSTIVTRHTIEEQRRQKVRILIAEDNPMNQKLAVTLLRKAGYWVDAVEDGRMVIETVKRRAYDLILMDVQMPEMDGFEATKIIREMEGETRHTAIIAMTAHAMKGDRERCLQAGMDGYISKPIATQELFDTINKWTKSYDEKEVSSQQEMFKKGAQTKDIPTGSEHVKPIDLEVALNRFGDDKEFFKEMVDEFLNYAPKQLEILTKAIERGDAKVVEREAHSIKGASGNLGAKHIADLSLQLELLGRTKDLAGAEEIIDNLKSELKHLEENFNQSLIA